MEREAGALGGLFQQIIQDMKVSNDLTRYRRYLSYVLFSCITVKTFHFVCELNWL